MKTAVHSRFKVGSRIGWGSENFRSGSVKSEKSAKSEKSSKGAGKSSVKRSSKTGGKG